MLRRYGAIFAAVVPMVVVALSEKSAVLHPQVISFIKEAVTGEWHGGPNQGIAAFFCYTDPQAFLKALSFRKSPILVTTPNNWHQTLAKLTAFKRSQTSTYLVDLNCRGAEGLVYEASKQRLLKIPNRWILLNITQPQGNAIAPSGSMAVAEDGAACRALAARLPADGTGFLESTATDSDVILVCGTAGQPLNLVDMWEASALGFWWPVNGKGYHGDRRPPSARRYAVGLGGRDLRVAFTVTKNDTFEHMDDGVNIQFDTITKFNWDVIHNVAKMLNATLVKRISNSYGYNVNGSWTGIIGMQLRGEAEMTGTSLAITTGRFAVIKFTNYFMTGRGAFVFRAPPMSYERNLFIQPFPKSLWAATMGIVLLCAVLLYGVLWTEQLFGLQADQEGSAHIIEGRKRQLDASGSEVALLAFGAVCQQGSPVEARGVAGRIITIFLFIAIVFLYTSYSASIVALLQSTSTSIRTYKDFLHSKITIGAESEQYNTYYMSKLQDPLRKKLYEKKIKRNMMTLAEGVKRMRNSYFAFHTIRSIIYTEIANTFKENEKCGLIEIPTFLSIQDPQLAISNWSQNTELIVMALRKNDERGIRHRQSQRFVASKPRCVNQGGNFQSVALIDCEAAFAVLGMGFGIALLFLLAEKLIFRFRHDIHRVFVRYVAAVPCSERH